MGSFANSISKLGSPYIWGPITLVSICLSLMPIVYAIWSVALGASNGELKLVSLSFFGGAASILGRALVVAVLSSLAAIPVAFQLKHLRSPTLRSVAIAALLIPFLINDSLRAFCWSRVFSATGPIAQLTSLFLGGAPETYSIRFTTSAFWFVLGMSILPFGVLGILPFVLEPEDRRWQAALELDGSSLMAAERTLLPMAMPGVALGYVWMFVVASFASAEEQYVGNSTSMAKIAASVLDRNVGSNWSEFFVLCVFVLTVLIGAALVAWLVYSRSNIVMRHVARAAEWMMRNRRLRRNRVRTYQKSKMDLVANYGTWIFTCTLIGFGLVPVLVIIVVAFVGVGGSSTSTWSDRFSAMFASHRTREALAASLLLAAITGTLIAIVGTFLASSWFWSKRLAVASLALCWFGAAFPPEAYALSVLKLAHSQTGGMRLLVFTHFVWCLPFAATVILARLTMISRSSLACAMELDNDSRLQTWWRIVLPLIWPAIFGGFVFGVLLSLNESARSAFVRGRVELLSGRIYGALESGLVGGNDHVFAVAATIVIATAVCGGAITVWLTKPIVYFRKP